MFPSFKSLADREQKRVDLLDRVQRRVRQNNVKRRLYAETAWVSDAGKTISLDKKESQDSSGQVEDGDLKKSVAPQVGTQLQTVASVAPVAQSTETVAPAEVKEVSPKVEASPVKMEVSQEIPEVKSEQIPDELRSDVGGVQRPHQGEDEPENEAKSALIKIFKIYPVLDKLQFIHSTETGDR
ncbi:hypothetical protein PI125_g13420 [Phytophthora idaei]|nr:hypothetical protein PI125_g13420 [Phytophthora idaei]KAG3165369.1 hypothetical protein PI126_g4677 [Phytophthora idaei]